MSSRRAQTCTQTFNWPLERWIFAAREVKVAVLILLCSFLIQPVSLAYANEGEVTEAVPAVEVVDPAPPEQIPEPEAGEDLEEIETEDVSDVGDEVVDDESADPSADMSNEELEVSEEVTDQTEVETATTSLEVVEEVATSTQSGADDDGLVDTTSVTSSETVASSTPEATNVPATTTSSVATTSSITTDSGTTTATSSNVADITTSTSGQSSGGSSEDAAEPDISEEDQEAEVVPDNTTVATSSAADNADIEEEIIEVSSQASSTVATTSSSQVATSSATSSVLIVTELSPIRNNDNFYQFGRGDCVSVGDDSFYCGAGEPTRVVEDRFFAAPDNDGDMEIYATIAGENYQLTDNRFEDRAPFYDPVSDTVVWHRLVNGRYQIMEYSFAEEGERQLSTGSVNNMQPTRYGDVVVWQQWVTNNWEIVMLENGELTQLTDNDHHDIAPAAYQEYIMWYEGGDGEEQRLAVYDRETKIVSKINDADGVAAKNPRMVILYDKQYDNGDVVTRGFDVRTGEIVPIGAVPSSMPEEIPASDQTGETRALIQQKTTIREDVVSEIDIPTPVTSGTTTRASTTTIAIEPGDVIVDHSSSTESSLTAKESIPDVVIKPLAESQTNSTSTELELSQ